MIPLYAFLEGDTIGLLLLAYPHETMNQLQTKLFSMARTRVEPNGEYSIQFQGRAVEANATVETLGLTPLDRIDVRRKGNEK